VYDLLVAPLTSAERQAYYCDSQRLARLLGIPPDLTPPEYDDFCNYMDAMLNSDALTVGEPARAVARALFSPPVTGRLAQTASFVGIGLLPERLREAYGLWWDADQEGRLRKLAAFTRRVRPLLPNTLCVHPGAARAERRLRSELSLTVI